MNRFSLPLADLIHENISIVMTFAYSRKPLVKAIDEKFLGEWKYLKSFVFDRAAERAERACIELAMFLRMLDDVEKISDYQKATRNVQNCGKLIMKNGSEKKLPIREVANKIIHASNLEWNFEKSPDPVLICHTTDSEKWLRAEIEILSVAAFCGGLMG